MPRDERAAACVAAHAAAKDEVESPSSPILSQDNQIRSSDGARTRLLHAWAWIENDPTAWAFIKREALRKARNGQMFGMHGLCDKVRNGDFSDNGGMPTKVNNNIVAALARILISEHPEVRPYMTLRHSVCEEDQNPTERK